MDNDIRIYTKGNAFKDGVYDLRSLEIIINSYRSILDRLIAVQSGRRQLTPNIKKQIDYDVRIKNGSLELLIDLVFEHRELLAVLASDGGYQLSKLMVKLLREAIDLRKAAASFLKKGIHFDIKITNSFNIGNNNVTTNMETKEIEISDPKILWAAQVTKYPVDNLISRVDGKEIEFVDFDSHSEKFRISPEDRGIIGKEQEKLPTTLKVVGRLDMVAFSSHRGAIVSDNERFPVTWAESIRAKMQKIADVDGIVFTVEPIIDRKRLHTEAIGFHVIDCVDPQYKLNI